MIIIMVIMIIIIIIMIINIIIIIIIIIIITTHCKTCGFAVVKWGILTQLLISLCKYAHLTSYVSYGCPPV